MNKRLKLLIVSPGILPVPDVKGGAVERLITMLVEDNEQYHLAEFTVVTCRDRNAIKIQNKFKYTKFLNFKVTNSKLLLKYGPKFQWHLQHKLNMDFIFYDRYYSCVYLHLLFNRNKYDMIIAEGDCFMNMNMSSKLVGTNRLCAHLHCNREATPEIEAIYGNIITVSKHILKNYRQSSQLLEERTLEVFNGIDITSLTKRMTISDKVLLRTMLNLKSDDFVVLFCGRIVPQKGVKELIEAILQIENPHIKLLIMGSSNFGHGDIGSYPQQVKQLVELHSNRIIFTGFVKNAEIYRYHQISNIGVVPSTYEDPCPLSLFEMITSGLPTIATRAGGISEIGTEETTVFVSLQSLKEDLTNSIKALYENNVKRTAMSSAAIERSSFFKSNRFYTDFCNEVSSLINQNQE